jgi:hypothetical protein
MALPLLLPAVNAIDNAALAPVMELIVGAAAR